MGFTRKVELDGKAVTFHANLTDSFRGYVYQGSRRVYGTLSPLVYDETTGYSYRFTPANAAVLAVASV